VLNSHVADDGFKLGAWVSSRRYERRAGTLSEQRIAELNALGVVWDFHDDNYRIGVDNLRAYIAREGHANMPNSYVTDDKFALGTWVDNRRNERKTGRLSTERIAELDALGVVWDFLDAGYRTGVEHLQAYIAWKGHANVPTSHVTDEGFALGKWVSHRRGDRKDGRLSAVKITELNALGITWAPFDAGYRNGVDHLRAYIAREGHAKVSQGYVTDDGYSLGNWVSSRRNARRAGTLSTERIAELDALGMVWDSRDARYRTGVAHLRAYITREGHANVPTSHVTDEGFTLGSWVSNRRSDCRAGRLAAEKIAELDALGMVWSRSAV